VPDVLTDVDGTPLAEGDRVRRIGTNTDTAAAQATAVVIGLVPAAHLVWLTDGSGDKEWLAIPATLRKVDTVSVGDEVSAGGVPYVITAADPGLVGTPVYGGDPVDLDVVEPVEDFDSDPGEIPDLSNVLRLIPRGTFAADRKRLAEVRAIRPAGGAA
jgi:hypothetical protein